MTLPTIEFASVAIGLAAISLALGWESFKVHSLLKEVPLRIAVTGSRGKSTLVRLILAALRQVDYQVVAKTTGTEPLLHHVDGQEERIVRRGHPSLLEVKKVLHLAKKEQAKALVVELMSLQPENLFIESVRLLQPHFLLVTNIREDHLEQMGATRSQIAQSLAAAIPLGGKVFLPEEEYFPVWKLVATKRKAELIKVSQHWPEEFNHVVSTDLPPGIFATHLRLLVALLREMGIDPKSVPEFWPAFRPDPGAPQVFSFKYGPNAVQWMALNAFAANDPLSTREVVDQFKRRYFSQEGGFIGVLNLRPDRGDRTWQWLKALRERMFPELEELVVIGPPARAFAQQARKNSRLKVTPLPQREANQIMEKLAQVCPQGSCLIGLGNIGGLGKALVNLWLTLAQNKQS